MEQKINIAELLKDCPKGMELDCTICDNVYFDEVTPYMIRCYIKNDTENNTIYFYKDGNYLTYNKAKCVIFPKGKTTWEGFQRPFKNGDIIYVESKSYSPGLISIYKEENSLLFYDYCAVSLDGKNFYLGSIYGLIQKDEIAISRLATEEEKAKLFQVIKDNGYKWNEETKTLEKLKKEYPKTYEECCNILDYDEKMSLGLVIELRKLIDARNAYWKIAGEQMGLGKPWKPDWQGEGCYVIVNHRGDIVTDVQWHANAILAFPTEEMRDFFFEHFKKDIEQCKELL